MLDPTEKSPARSTQPADGRTTAAAAMCAPSEWRAGNTIVYRVGEPLEINNDRVHPTDHDRLANEGDTLTGPMAPMPPGQYPMEPPPRSDNTTLFGVLGIVLAICFWPAGFVLSILAMNAAARVHKPRTLGVIGLILSGIAAIISIIRVVAYYN
jgi:hypothetical protein